jgi:hypothetical protein
MDQWSQKLGARRRDHPTIGYAPKIHRGVGVARIDRQHERIGFDYGGNLRDLRDIRAGRRRGASDSSRTWLRTQGCANSRAQAHDRPLPGPCSAISRGSCVAVGAVQAGVVAPPPAPASSPWTHRGPRPSGTARSFLVMTTCSTPPCLPSPRRAPQAADRDELRGAALPENQSTDKDLAHFSGIPVPLLRLTTTICADLIRHRWTLGG